MSDVDSLVASSLRWQRDSYIREASGIVAAQTSAAEKEIANLNTMLEAKDASIVNRANEIKNFEADVKTSIDKIAGFLDNFLKAITPPPPPAPPVETGPKDSVLSRGIMAGVSILDPILPSAAPSAAPNTKSKVIPVIAVIAAAFFILKRKKRR